MLLQLLLAALLATAPTDASTNVTGAWRHVREDGTVGTWIVTDKYFSIAWYRQNPAKFVSTEGGSWIAENGAMYAESIEFFSRDDAKAGMSLEFQYDCVDGTWHHVGKSTAGEPMHEL